MEQLKGALPQIIFIVVLVINLITAITDADRNFTASLIATGILMALTFWGGFFQPLFILLKA